MALALAAIFLVLFSTMAHAHCPLCTAAIGAATVSLGIFGVSTSVIGLMVGAFAVSTGMMVGKIFGRRWVAVSVMVSFAVTVLPLLYMFKDVAYIPVYLYGEPGSLLNRVYFVNRFLLFSAVGGLEVIAAYLVHSWIKNSRGVLFPYQGIAITLLVLALTAAAMVAYGL